MSNESQKLLLKDQLFNKEIVIHLSNLLKKVYPSLKGKEFTTEILKEFPKLELKQRITCIQEKMYKFLPQDYETTLKILKQSLKGEEERFDFAFSGYPAYIAVYGLSKNYLDISLEALGEFTKYFSAEFAIRHFINRFPNETFLIMERWSKSKNYHKRRLASEGLRPKLPWAKGITYDYKTGASLLNNLFYDKVRYVTRSVANHLNDISKIDPDFVIETLKRWKESKKQNSKEMNYIIKHSLRTLIKKGHSGTLEFLGYSSDPNVSIKNLKVHKDSINLGDTLEFSFDLHNHDDNHLVVDYKITYPTPHKRESIKVFKIKTLTPANGKVITISKRHTFKKMTTKRLYSGKYKIELQINGNLLEKVHFNLNVD